MAAAYPEPQMSSSNLAETAIRHILGSPTTALRTLTVANLAQKLGVDRSHLARVFKAHLGCKLCEFLRNERLNRAIHLLTHRPDLTIKSISHQIGFTSPEYFTRLFKTHHHITPQHYRDLKAKIPQTDFKSRDGDKYET